MNRTTLKLAITATVFLALGLVACTYGEIVSVPPFLISHYRPWSNWHNLSIVFFVISAAIFVACYWSGEKK